MVNPNHGMLYEISSSNVCVTLISQKKVDNMDTSGINRVQSAPAGSVRKMKNVRSNSAFVEPKDGFQKSEENFDLGKAAKALFQKPGDENAPSLDVNWKKDFGKRLEGTMLSPDGKTLYVGIDRAFGGKFCTMAAFDPVSGKEKWSLPLENGSRDNSMAVTQDDKSLIFSDAQGTMTALDVSGKKPKEKWTFTPGDSYVDEPILSPDGKDLLVFCMFKNASYGNVYALNPENGEVKWKTPVNHPVSGPPVFSPDGKQFHIKMTSHGVSSFNLEDGSPKWDKETLEHSRFPLQSLDGGKTLLSMNFNDEIIAVDAATGSETVVMKVPKEGHEIAGVSVKNNIILLKSYRGDLTGVDIKDGRKKWMIPLGNTTIAPILSKDETELYAAKENGDFLVIEPQTGEVKGMHLAEDEKKDCIYTQPELSPDGKSIIVGHFSGKLYSLALGNTDEKAEQAKKAGEIIKNENEVIIGGVKLALNKK